MHWSQHHINLLGFIRDEMLLSILLAVSGTLLSIHYHCRTQITLQTGRKTSEAAYRSQER